LALPKQRDILSEYFFTLTIPALPLSLLLTIIFVISGLFYLQFQTFSISVVMGYCLFCMGSSFVVRKYKMKRTDSIYIHGLILVLFSPLLDLRWFRDLYIGPPSMGYDWWALYMTVVGAACWGVFDTPLPNFGYSFWPIKWREILWGFAGLLPLSVIIIPLGLLSGFLQFSTTLPSFWDVIAFWLENMTTVAITEELFFRAVFMNLVDVVFPSKRGWIAVCGSSLIFGLWHIPRRTNLVGQALYVVFAFIAGVIYSVVYKLGGNNIVGSSITHSITDTVWAFALTA